MTDAHDLAFVQPFRTLVFASDRSEQGILSAVREGYFVTLHRRGISGAPRLVDVMLVLIEQGEYLQARYKARAADRVGHPLQSWREGGL